MAEPAPPSDSPLTRLTVIREPRFVRIRFSIGRADGIAVRELYETAASLVDHPPVRLLVDFHGVDLITSGMMGMLVQLRKMFLQHGGQLHVLLHMSQHEEQFRVANLHIMLSIFRDGDAAVGFKD